MKIIIDTNIFISGIFFKGLPYNILNAWKNGKFKLVISNEILHAWEVERNGLQSDMHKAFEIHKIDSASISDRAFIPKWEIEL